MSELQSVETLVDTTRRQPILGQDMARYLEACTTCMLDGSAPGVPTSSYVRINPDAMQPLVERVAAAGPSSWNWFLRDPESSLQNRWFDIAFCAALNGGYYTPGPAGGQSVHWNLDGSGSSALLEWIEGLRAARLLPWIDHKGLGHSSGGGRRYLEAVHRLVLPLPYGHQRGAIIAEFATNWGRASNWLANQVVADAQGVLSCTLGLQHVEMLAQDLPLSFGADPFRKKACLAIMMLASHLRWQECNVVADIPIPADYQMPRILQWLGVLEYTPCLVDLLALGTQLDPNSAPVVHMRAAAVLACHSLATMAGVEDWMVDIALFSSTRKDPDFQANSLPPMHIDGMWF